MSARSVMAERCVAIAMSGSGLGQSGGPAGRTWRFERVGENGDECADRLVVEGLQEASGAGCRGRAGQRR